MDFIPLAIWCTGMMVNYNYEFSIYLKNGYTKEYFKEECVPVLTQGYITGFLIFLLLGIGSCTLSH